jgi:hypothetical protein
MSLAAGDKPNADLKQLRQVQLFGVRHHSPRATASLLQLLEQRRPRLVLVEGPADATGLVNVLTDKGTVPPVAILGYRTSGEPGSTAWPFASYSPEYAALLWARRAGVQAELIDISTGVALSPELEAWDEIPATDHAEASGGEQAEEAGEGDVAEAIDDIHELAAQQRGFRNFEEMWEASFELPRYGPAQFNEAICAWADLSRACLDRTVHRARDAVMARAVLGHLQSGKKPAEIVVVAGAAHVAALRAGDVDLHLADSLPAPVETVVTLIPYSFPRLSEQLGYGAGNRAPYFYQRAHDAGCSFTRATLEVLLEFGQHLRLRGFSASLADTIEAYRLAVTLAQLRDKAEPGLDELREAAVATLCRGDATWIDRFLWTTVVGKRVGKTTARLGRNSLQEEFWREVKARLLPEHDQPQSFDLKLQNPVEVGCSIFLHRLRVADVPYAAFIGSHTVLRGKKKGDDEQPGGVSALSRVRERWEAQWTPATDIALAERITLGDSLQQVTTQVLQQQLGDANSTGKAADVLLESVVADCPQTITAALDACEGLAAQDDDLPSLAQACRALSGLVSYGTSRSGTALGAEAIPALCSKTFSRAVLRVREACSGDAEALVPVLDALRTLHDIALSQPLVDKQSWLAVARELMESWAVNPLASGLACGLLFLAQELDEAETSLVVGQRLGSTIQPEKAAAFLEGFLHVNAMVLVKNRPVVQALDAFLNAIPAERFKDTLPSLRRALGGLGSTERRYLLENVVAVRRLHAAADEARAIVEDKDKEQLSEMAAELDAALDDLDDLL